MTYPSTSAQIEGGVVAWDDSCEHRGKLPQGEPDAHVGKSVVDLRTAARLSKTQLAQRAGVSRSTISRIELGQVQPSPDVLDRIARAIDLAVIDRSGSPSAPRE